MELKIPCKCLKQLHLCGLEARGLMNIFLGVDCLLLHCCATGDTLMVQSILLLFPPKLGPPEMGKMGSEISDVAPAPQGS